jgi:hypothetical protein
MRKVQTLEEKTACGDTWTIAASATEVVLTYPRKTLLFYFFIVYHFFPYFYY